MPEVESNNRLSERGKVVEKGDEGWKEQRDRERGGREVKGHRGRDRGRYHETIEVSCLKFRETQLRPCCDFQASLIGQLVKNLPAMQETLVQFLGQEDPLEKG